ncbi:MAG: radical SAM protein [Bacteroidetes bacterium]|nr:radical SAM protein [Bacteroidota bacterium]
METHLFENVIFGPINSRRLGVSLGVNLLPLGSKLCNFDCVYCECGWTDLKSFPKIKFFSREDIKIKLKEKLEELSNNKTALNSITFAGNGEPTMHPLFEEIIDDTIELRNLFYPECKISVLSNSLMLNNPKVVAALKKIDNRIMKLDAGSEKTFHLINQPLNNRNLDWVIQQLKKFNGDLTIQTLFVKGDHNGAHIDNTTEEEINSWLEILKTITPKEVMLYSIDRPTPEKNLEKIPKDKLIEIAEKVKLIGIDAIVN